MKQALRLFDRLADNRDMVFEKITEKCYARAHLMARAMEREGYTPRKAWAVVGGKKFPDVFFQFRDAAGQSLKWRFHVAAALPVRQANGRVRNMVFDPALFDGPVTLREWGKALGLPSRNLSVVEFDESPPGYGGNYTPASRIRHDTDQKAYNSLYELRGGKPPSGARNLRTVFASAARIEVMGEDAPVSAFRGRTWETIRYQSRHPSFPL
jgi:hypothetical protein